MDNFHLIAKYAICYSIFFLILLFSKAEHSNRLFDSKGFVSKTGTLLGLQLGGILWLGVIPFFILHSSFNLIVFGQQPPGLFQLCILFLLLVVGIAIAIIESGKINTDQASQEQQVRFNKKFIRRYILYRSIFITSYELFFRGYLLTDSLNHTGIFSSVIINTCLYSLLHVFNGRKEIVACFVFGIIICCVCVWIHAAWPAMIIHTTFTLIYELKLVKKNRAYNK